MKVITLTVDCKDCGSKVRLQATGAPELRATATGWEVVIPAEGWDYEAHRLGHVIEQQP